VDCPTSPLARSERGSSDKKQEGGGRVGGVDYKKLAPGTYLGAGDRINQNLKMNEFQSRRRGEFQKRENN